MTAKQLLAATLLAGVFLTPAEARLPLTPTPASAPAPTGTAPALVLILRHAEKPEGDRNDIGLTPVGFHRAQLLPRLFSPHNGQPALPRPDVIFATDTSKHSNRPIETITPLAQVLQLRINHDFSDHEAPDLARLLLSGKYGGKVVLVCWHHGEIPHLAQSLGVLETPKWSDDTYDQVWSIDWSSGHAVMTVIPEMLLDGDKKP